MGTHDSKGIGIRGPPKRGIDQGAEGKGNYSQIKQDRGLKFVSPSRLGHYRITMKSRDFSVTMGSNPRHPLTGCVA